MVSAGFILFSSFQYALGLSVPFLITTEVLFSLLSSCVVWQSPTTSEIVQNPD